MIRLREIGNRIVRDIRFFGIPFFAGIAALILFHCLMGTVCPVRAFFGIPCPGCGLTRSCLSILMGRFRTAFRFNPAGFLWLPFLAVLFFKRYVLGKKMKYLTFELILVCSVTWIQWIFRMGIRYFR